MITVGRAIMPFLKGRRIYYSTQRFNSPEIRESFQKEEIVFCRSVTDLPDKLEKIFQKILENQGKNSFRREYFEVSNYLIFQ